MNTCYLSKKSSVRLILASSVLLARMKRTELFSFGIYSIVNFVGTTATYCNVIDNYYSYLLLICCLPVASR